jgi:hypothetical protein
MGRFVACNPQKYYSGDETNGDEMGGARGTMAEDWDNLRVLLRAVTSSTQRGLVRFRGNVLALQCQGL